MTDNYRPESTAIANDRRLNDTCTVNDRRLKDAYTVYVCQYGLWLSRCEKEPPYRPATEGPHYEFSKIILESLRTEITTQNFQGGDLGTINMLRGYAASDLGWHSSKILAAEVTQRFNADGLEIEITGKTSSFENRSICMLSYEDVPHTFSITLRIVKTDYERFWHDSFNPTLTIPPHWLKTP